MLPSSNCIKLIEDSEGLRLRPYHDTKGVATIGLGSTFYENGTPVTMNDSPITKERAYSLMQTVLSSFARKVSAMLSVSVSQNEFDALCDFAYNCGPENLHTSTLLRKLNANDRQGAAAEFGKWNHDDGVVEPGLTTRRANERALFLSED